jgi:hypothetical protein
MSAFGCRTNVPFVGRFQNVPRCQSCDDVIVQTPDTGITFLITEVGSA